MYAIFASLGPRFGASLVQSLMGADPGKERAGPATTVLDTLDEDNRPLGGSVTTAIFSKLQHVAALILL